jgi:hypothetical protein
MQPIFLKCYAAYMVNKNHEPSLIAATFFR